MFMRWAPTLCVVGLMAGSASAQQWGPWHAVGPFEHVLGHVNLDERHEPERQLSEMKHGRQGPDLGRVFRGEERVDARWHEIAGGSTAFDVGLVQLPSVLPAVPGKANWADYSAAYLYRKGVVGSDREVRVHMGSDDGLKVWLNGALVFERATGRGVNVYDEALVLPMREGVNHLLVKVVNGEGGWGFQMAPWRTLNQLGINQAIDRGVQYFLDRQLIDGSWGYYSHIEPGPTAFRLYTLLKCGVRTSHPAIQRGRAYILAHENDATYPLSTKIMALAEMNEEGDKERIQDLLKLMWDNQLKDGLFHYSIDGYNSHHQRGDLSNALFAGLAMRAASQAGVTIKPTRWAELAKGALACWGASDGLPRTGGLAEPRGFSYVPHGGQTSSMTVAGVSMLVIVDEQAGDRITGKLRNPVKMGIRSGLAWLEHNFSWTTNVGQGGGYHNFFSVYGIERVGGLLDTPVVANRDWYFEGSRQLLAWQSSGGTWSEKSGHTETELALLFLKRATARASGRNKNQGQSSWTTEDDPSADVALRGIGDTPVTFWIESVHKDVQGDLEWEGQVGQGPHISRVDYYARREVPGAKVERIKRITADPGAAMGSERFALRHRFPANGIWLVHARVMCVHESTAAGVLGEEVELLSAELEVIIKDVVTPAQLAYAEDAKKNLLRTITVHGSASSQIGGEEAQKAVDGAHITRWRCVGSDAAPKLKLSLGRPIRGRRVALSHGLALPIYREHPRVLRGELILNGRDHFNFQMDPDVMTKTEIDLGRSHRIRTIELKVIDVMDGVVGGSAVGFSEVEVYR